MTDFLVCVLYKRCYWAKFCRTLYLLSYFYTVYIANVLTVFKLHLTTFTKRILIDRSVFAFKQPQATRAQCRTDRTSLVQLSEAANTVTTALVTPDVGTEVVYQADDCAVASSAEMDTTSTDSSVPGKCSSCSCCGRNVQPLSNLHINSVHDLVRSLSLSVQLCRPVRQRLSVV